MVRRVDPAVRVRVIGPSESRVPTRAHAATAATAGDDPDGPTEVTSR